jgi:hypothetical protein
MEEEEEGTSYLADLNKAPDFIDEAPFEVTEVRMRSSCPIALVLTLQIFLQPTQEIPEAIKTT